MLPFLLSSCGSEDEFSSLQLCKLPVYHAWVYLLVLVCQRIVAVVVLHANTVETYEQVLRLRHTVNKVSHLFLFQADVGSHVRNGRLCLVAISATFGW